MPTLYTSVLERRAEREALEAHKRLMRPHAATLTCELCPQTFTIPDAERYNDAELAVAFHKAGWANVRQTLCPAHVAIKATASARRAKAGKRARR